MRQYFFRHTVTDELQSFPVNYGAGRYEVQKVIARKVWQTVFFLVRNTLRDRSTNDPGKRIRLDPCARRPSAIPAKRKASRVSLRIPSTRSERVVGNVRGVYKTRTGYEINVRINDVLWTRDVHVGK